MNWWTLVGVRQEPRLIEVRRIDVVNEDSVHLTRKMNRKAAVYLCNRLMELKKGDRRTNKMEKGRLLM
jgi:hypothetical protein